MKKRIATGLLAALCAVWLAGAVWAAPPGEASFNLDIPSQSLNDALQALALASRHKLLYSSELVDGKTSPAVKGRFTTEEAVKRLLMGTDLKYEVTADGLVLIRATGVTTAAAKDPPGDSKKEDGKNSSQDFRVAQVDQGKNPVVGALDAQRNGTEASGGPVLQEIIVTAQKREERLMDVPASVAVLSPDTLSGQGVLQLRDFADLVPGMSVASLGAGYSQIVMRGLTLGQNTDPLPSTVTYIDDVPYGSYVSAGSFSNFNSLDPSLTDMQRIEVLKGPQGTLYGADAIGGVLKYVTYAPTTDSFYGKVQAGTASTQDGGVSYNASASVNVPLVTDQLALRASGWYSHDGGYIDNLALGQNDVNRSGIYGGRLDLMYTPSDKLTIRLGGFAQDISRDGTAFADYDLSGRPLDGPLDQRRLISEPFDQHFRLASATVTYDLDWARLISISSYQTIRQDITYDISWEAPLFEPSAAFYGFDNGLGKISNPNHTSTNKFTQEVRLSSERHGSLEWIIGAFYTHEATNILEYNYFFDVAGQPTGNANADFAYSYPVTFEEYAPFGTLTWHLAKKLDLSAGVRYSHSSQIVSQRVYDTQPYETVRSSEDAVTYLADASYHFSDRAVTYLRYATGYRPGGPNFEGFNYNTGMSISQPPFRSDKLKTYELGFKGDTSDRRFGVEVAGFYYDWQDLQLYTFTNTFQGYTNATGGARILGGELSITARPVSALTLAGAFTVLDARLRQAEPALGAVQDERLPNTGRYTVNLSANYVFAPEGLRPTLGANLRVVPDRNASFDNGASVGTPQYRLPGYTAVDLQAGLTLGRVDTQLYVRNLFDTRGQLSAETYPAGFNGPVWVSLIQPRTVGITATMRF